jgi:hypothetical protein
MRNNLWKRSECSESIPENIVTPSPSSPLIVEHVRRSNRQTNCIVRSITSSIIQQMLLKGKGKAVPLHALEALGGRGGIAPTHSRPRHYMGVSGQSHAPAALLPPGKGPAVPIVQEAGWAPEPVWTQRIQEKSFAPAGDRTPIVQPVVRHYTAWANPAPNKCY